MTRCFKTKKISLRRFYKFPEQLGNLSHFVLHTSYSFCIDSESASLLGYSWFQLERATAMGPGGPGGPGPGPGPGGPPGWGPPAPGPGFFGGFCDVIGSCLSFLCCCWLLQDCFGGPPGPAGPPGPP